MSTEQRIFTKAQEKTNDVLLDELNFHLGEIERIKGELASSLIDKSDSELHDEQRNNAAVVNKAFENPLTARLHEEEEKILEIKQKMSQQTH